ncbi:MAG: hypothetical protein M1524_00900 [Patescibacteria group bacterium]|nr:hypothetical protein [Patescibacteria group bacterium]
MNRLEKGFIGFTAGAALIGGSVLSGPDSAQAQAVSSQDSSFNPKTTLRVELQKRIEAIVEKMDVVHDMNSGAVLATDGRGYLVRAIDLNVLGGKKENGILTDGSKLQVNKTDSSVSYTIAYPDGHIFQGVANPVKKIRIFQSEVCDTDNTNIQENYQAYTDGSNFVLVGLSGKIERAMDLSDGEGDLLPNIDLSFHSPIGGAKLDFGNPTRAIIKPLNGLQTSINVKHVQSTEVGFCFPAGGARAPKGTISCVPPSLFK